MPEKHLRFNIYILPEIRTAQKANPSRASLEGFFILDLHHRVWWVTITFKVEQWLLINSR